MKRLWLIATLAAVLGISILLARGYQRLIGDPPKATEIAYSGSQSCESCHQDRHASWQRTFHRTMTQTANAKSVVGAFDGQTLSAFGAVVRPQHSEGRYWFEYFDQNNQALAKLDVVRTVGSHRYQQYLMKDADSETYYRLHYLWHIQEKRWVHMNAAFLGDDLQPFDAQVTSWNTNCVFCHNTGPEPRVSNLNEIRARAQSGERMDVRAELRFDTKVAELGISCESCHGAGMTHVEKMQQWPQRLLARFGVKDRSIVKADDLTAARSNSICGACHAGRTPKSANDIDAIYSKGLSFRPGELLEDHLTVLHRDTPSPSAAAPDLFANRFWADGSPRLTAYEYQGQAASRCAQDPKLTCIRCHTMHSGEPASMLPSLAPDAGDAPCLRCHQELKADIAEHTKHPLESAGARCMSCHMPRAVYGVMTLHRTHLISVPNVSADLAAGKPNACLNCHVEKTPAWAAQTTTTLWPKLAAGTPEPIVRGDGADVTLSDGLAALLAGDPVRQAVVAFELGQVEQSNLKSLPPRVPWLLQAMADDRPAIRRFAWQSLQAIDATLQLTMADTLQQFDYTGASAQRAAVLARLNAEFAAFDKSAWPAPAAETGLDANYLLRAEVLASLLAVGAATEKQIEVGE